MKAVFNEDNKKGIRYTIDLWTLQLEVSIKDLFSNPGFQKQLAACDKLRKKKK